MDPMTAGDSVFPGRGTASSWWPPTTLMSQIHGDREASGRVTCRGIGHPPTGKGLWGLIPPTAALAQALQTVIPQGH